MNGHYRPRIVKRVSAVELRTVFNEHYLDRALRGELTELILKEREPAPPLAGEPQGTKSIYSMYFDGSTAVAAVHYYRRADGTLGLSGKPDPKKVLVDGTLYLLERRPKVASS